jgi:hypothetical protein
MPNPRRESNAKNGVAPCFQANRSEPAFQAQQERWRNFQFIHGSKFRAQQASSVNKNNSRDSGPALQPASQRHHMKLDARLDNQLTAA